MTVASRSCSPGMAWRREAFAERRAGRIHAVVTDIRMPRLDGLGLAERIRTLPNPPPSIFIWSFGQHGLPPAQAALAPASAGSFVLGTTLPLSELVTGSPPLRGTGRSLIDPHPALHHAAHALLVLHILQRLSAECHEIGSLARLEHPRG